MKKAPSCNLEQQSVLVRVMNLAYFSGSTVIDGPVRVAFDSPRQFQLRAALKLARVGQMVHYYRAYFLSRALTVVRHASFGCGALGHESGQWKSVEAAQLSARTQVFAAKPLLRSRL